MTLPEKPSNNTLPELIRRLFEKLKHPSGNSQPAILNWFLKPGANTAGTETPTEESDSRLRNLTSRGVTSTPLQYVPTLKPMVRNATTIKPAQPGSVKLPSISHFKQVDPFLTPPPSDTQFSAGDPFLAAHPSISHYNPENPPPELELSTPSPELENSTPAPQPVPQTTSITAPSSLTDKPHTAPGTARKPFFQLSKTLPAFWTVTGVLSLLVNVFLIAAVYLLGRELFLFKAMVGDQLLGGLYENFIYMDQAHIQSNISLTDTVPVSFNLPISQDTLVVLTEDTTINGANVRISTGGIDINSAATIVLPAGTNLPVHLELNVPVTTSIPIQFNTPIDIPLEQTQLHKPIIGLQQVIAPLYQMLQPGLKNPQDLPICQPFAAFCSSYFK